MRSFVVLFALVAIAFADVSHLGYQYKVPHTSYGVPAYETKDTTNFGYQKVVPQVQLTETSGFSSQQNFQQPSNFGQTHGNYYQYQTEQHYQLPSTQFTGTSNNGNYNYQGSSHFQQPANHLNGQSTGGSFQYQGAQHNFQQPSSQAVYDAVSGSGNSNFGSSGSTGQVSGANSQGFTYHTSGISQSNFESSEKSQSFKKQYVQVQQQPAQVFKHFYVHAAPEEPEVTKVRQAPVLPPPQKHYKVIFIKTPAPPAPPPPVPVVSPQSEEKTLVYVLVQKPEEAKEIVLPKVEPKAPSKPEVFFIKYSGKDGHQAAIDNIVNDFNSKTSGTVLTHASGSGSSVAPSYSEGTLSDSTLESTGSFQSSGSLSGFGSGSVTTGSLNSGSLSLGQGSSEVHHEFSAPAVQQTSFEAPSQTIVHDHVNEISSGSANSVQNQESFPSVSTSQGLPHATYGVPNFRS